MVDDLCFKKPGLHHFEFPNLFKALFDQSDVHLEIIRCIEKGNNAVSRSDLARSLGKSSGERLNARLNELEASGFIQSFIPYEKRRRGRFYRIVDEYTLFYMKWIDPRIKSRIIEMIMQ